MSEGLDREAAELYKLGNLVRKDRSALKARLVQAVLHENCSTAEKISKINAIDLKPEDETEAEHHPRPKRHIRPLDIPPPHRAGAKPAGEAADAADATAAEVPAPKKPAKEGSKETAGGKADKGRTDAAAAEKAEPMPQPSSRREPGLALTPDERRGIRNRFAAEAPLGNPRVQQAARARVRAAREPESGGFFRYLISDYWKIAEFGRNSRTFDDSAWPFMLRYSLAVPAFVERTLKTEYAETLRAVLQPLLRKGWLFLEKHEYNLIAALNQLAAVVGKLECRMVKGRPELAVGNLLPAASLCVAFSLKSGLLEQACSVLAKASERASIPEQDRVRAVAAARLCLDPTDTGLTLPNLVRAVWMKQGRSFFELAQLRAAGVDPAQLFCADAFDCPADVQMEIDRHIAQLVGRLDAIDAEAVEIRRWRAYLPPAAARTRPQTSGGEGGKSAPDPFDEALQVDGAGRPVLLRVDFTALRAFYEGNPNFKEFRMGVDRAVPLLLLVRLLDIYRYAFEELCSGYLRTASGRVEVMQPGLLSSPLVRLEQLRNQLQEDLVAMPHLGEYRWRDLLNGKLTGSAAEMAMAGRVRDVSQTFTAIGKSVADLVKSRSAFAALPLRSGVAGAPATPLPNELAVAQGGALAGKTAIDCLVELATVSLQAGMYLAMGEMDGVVGREQELVNMVAPIREGLERLAAPDQVAMLREAYAEMLGTG